MNLLFSSLYGWSIIIARANTCDRMSFLCDYLRVEKTHTITRFSSAN